METFQAVIETGKGNFILCYHPQGGLQRLIFPGKGPENSFLPVSLPWPQLADDLRSYLIGEPREFNYPIDWSECTPFVRKVLLHLKHLPYGHLCSYAELAQEVGCPKGARAVGRALSLNPLPIIIPCHRVVRSDGGWGGFSSGLGWKKYLINLESNCDNV